MVLGEKIRRIRTLKGLSQENLAEMLGLSLPAYADIERGKKDVSMNRLEQIAEKFGITVMDILKFDGTVSNFFDQGNQTNVINGKNGNQTYYQDNREIQHKLEKAMLENRLLQTEKEKAELEAKYWREKSEK